MKDTSEEIQKVQKELFFKKSNSERLIMAIEMIEDGKRLVELSIKNINKNISPLELKAEVFKRFYSKDFSAAELSIIQDYLKQEKK